MTDDELRRAIERPARLAGLEPEPGLIELLVDDIRGRTGTCHSYSSPSRKCGGIARRTG